MYVLLNLILYSESAIDNFSIQKHNFNKKFQLTQILITKLYPQETNKLLYHTFSILEITTQLGLYYL